MPQAPPPEAAPTPASAVAWSITLPAAPMFPPVIAGDRVFVAHLPGQVSAFAAADGRELWRVDLRPDAPLVVDDERVLASAGEAIHALRVADGGVLWRAPSGTVKVRPVTREGWVVVASEGSLRALRAADGTSVWTRELPYVRQTPAISGNTLIVASADGWIRSLDLRTGEVIWESRAAGAPAEPLVVGDRIYFGATDRRFYAMKLADGEIDWLFRIGAAIPMKAAADGERVYFVALDNLVRGHDARSGNARWQQGLPFRPWDGPVLAGAFVVIAGDVPDVRLLRAADGGPVPPMTFPERLAAAPGISEADGTLRVVGVTGSLQEPWKLSLLRRAPSNVESRTPH